MTEGDFISFSLGFSKEILELQKVNKQLNKIIEEKEQKIFDLEGTLESTEKNLSDTLETVAKMTANQKNLDELLEQKTTAFKKYKEEAEKE